MGWFMGLEVDSEDVEDGGGPWKGAHHIKTVGSL